jgi:methylenetetrahydrofolate reductase (NADPH)
MTLSMIANSAAPAMPKLSDGETWTAIRDLAIRASLETAARNAAEVDDFAALLREGTEVFVAWVPGRTPDTLVQVAARLRRLGANPVPHLAAREIPSAAALNDLLARLRGEADVAKALVISGDTREAAGPFASSVMLLETGALQNHGIRRIAIAAYPEGHPRIPPQDLATALRAKVEYAARHGLTLMQVSQFAFDGGFLARWARERRALYPTLDLRIGLAGPANLGTLLRYAARCGIGASARALGERTASLTRLLGERGPETAIRALVEQGALRDIEGIHLYSFGGGRPTARWLAAVAAGKFRLGESEGFVVEG